MIIGAVMDDFKNGGAYVGTCPWAYGGIWRPETQVVNEFGMVWAGDPPHESPGKSCFEPRSNRLADVR
jgi:mannan endo-1,4-beta-mannosidase